MDKKDLADVFADLKCPVCLELANDPVESACCHHIYCSKCAKGLKANCAVCRKETTFAPSVIAKRIINNLPVTCSHCDKRFTRGIIKDHERQCVPIKCPAEECDFQGNTPTFLHHLIEKHEEIVLSKIDRLFLLSKDDVVGKLRSTQNGAHHTARLWANTQSPGGKFYCEKKLEPFCECCDGFCGPVNGCNCKDCMKLDVERLQLPKGYLVNRDGAIAKHATNGRFYCGRIIKAENNRHLRCDDTTNTQCYACEVLRKQKFTRYASLM